MKIRKIIICILAIIICISSSCISYAFSIEKGHIYNKGQCEFLLKNTETGMRFIVDKAFYKNNGKEYPAYCLNVELGGVGKFGDYDVTVDEAVKNTLVWRVITNGYPYQSFETMGVKNEEEAFTATKQAVYCVLYGYDKDDFARYEAIGEAGERTLEAMKKMVKKARSSNQSIPSNKITITQSPQWEIDKTNNNYVSKTFKVSAECNMGEYKISLSDDKEKQIRITDLNGKDITKTTQKEFKIMIPINLLEKDDSFEVNVEGNVETKAILYGKSNKDDRQDYALTGASFELGNGSTKVKYYKNTSKLRIIKKDNENENALKGVQFRIVNEKNEEVYSNLLTNEKGEIIIEGIQPGKYFLEEVNPIEGYKKLKNRIEFDITVNEEVQITVRNQKEDTPNEKINLSQEKSYAEENETQQKRISLKEIYPEKITKLPVTGM